MLIATNALRASRCSRRFQILFAMVLYFATTASVCNSPTPPACRASLPCQTGQERICDSCVPVTSTIGDACDPDLCSGGANKRCSAEHGLVCIDQTCQRPPVIGRACSGTCAAGLFCFDQNATGPTCDAERARTDRTISALKDLGIPVDESDKICIPYILDEGLACDSNYDLPLCSPCLPGLSCIDGTCQRPCDPSASDPSTGGNSRCTCSGEVCSPNTGATLGGTCAACIPLGERLGSKTTATGMDVWRCCDPTATEEDSPPDYNLYCCRKNGDACTQATDCCGQTGTNGACSASGHCETCHSVGGAGTAGGTCSSVADCCHSNNNDENVRCDLAGQSTGMCCPANYGHCSATSTKCDTNLQNDASNCGGCGHSCGTNGVCVDGRCQTSCPAGFGTCPGGTSCATNFLNDANNCGSCGNVCPSTTTCSNGRCVCPPQWLQCGNPLACRDVLHDNMHCGASCTACPPNTACSTVSGAATCVSTCASPENGHACTGPGDNNIPTGAQPCCTGYTCDLLGHYCVPTMSGVDGGTGAVLENCAICSSITDQCAANTLLQYIHECGPELRCRAHDGSTMCD